MQFRWIRGGGGPRSNEVSLIEPSLELSSPFWILGAKDGIEIELEQLDIVKELMSFARENALLLQAVGGTLSIPSSLEL